MNGGEGSALIQETDTHTAIYVLDTCTTDFSFPVSQSDMDGDAFVDSRGASSGTGARMGRRHAPFDLHGHAGHGNEL